MEFGWAGPIDGESSAVSTDAVKRSPSFRPVSCYFCKSHFMAELKPAGRKGSTLDENTFDLFLEADQATSQVLEDLPIRERQVQQLREAFTAAGIDSMDDRRAIIESCTIRQVDSIGDLLARDVRPILRRIEERSLPAKQISGSAWDNREEDTWIDKL
ncbi:ABC-type thiamine transport system ATPase subunit [Arthrobacter sp. B2I5]|nr:ABC-type thiamine transport system ATPase subunit [Arthrobacter sp. B2I5]